MKKRLNLNVLLVSMIGLLLVVIALIVYVLIIGQAHIEPKSAYISARGMNVNLSIGPGSYANTIGLFHFQGDAVTQVDRYAMQTRQSAFQCMQPQ